jgi:hypothetical protein
MVCSTRRPDRPCDQAEALARQARGLGIRTEVLPQNRSHGEINAQLGMPGDYTDAVERFMATLHPAWASLLGH